MNAVVGPTKGSDLMVPRATELNHCLLIKTQKPRQRALIFFFFFERERWLQLQLQHSREWVCHGNRVSITFHLVRETHLGFVRRWLSPSRRRRNSLTRNPKKSSMQLRFKTHLSLSLSLLFHFEIFSMLGWFFLCWLMKWGFSLEEEIAIWGSLIVVFCLNFIFWRAFRTHLGKKLGFSSGGSWFHYKVVFYFYFLIFKSCIATCKEFILYLTVKFIFPF